MTTIEESTIVAARRYLLTELITDMDELLRGVLQVHAEAVRAEDWNLAQRQSGRMAQMYFLQDHYREMIDRELRQEKDGKP